MKNEMIQNQNLVKTISLALVALILLSATLLFQTSPVGVSGKLMYEDKTVVDDAVISILNVTDRSLVTSGITELDGTFTFKNIEEGSYLISIQIMDQPHKVYGPVHIGGKQSHLVIKPLYLPVPPAKKKIALQVNLLAEPSTI